MALCVWKEARGEGELGMKAVADVIVNRAKDQGNGALHPIHTVAYAKNQFTSMSVPSDPEFNLQPQSDDKQQYEFARSVCQPIVEGQMSDITNGALYYANLAHVSSGWFEDNIVKNTVLHPQVAVIGKQTFYK
jgi:N-acetylmuramoyl-L-alanine amidase